MVYQVSPYLYQLNMCHQSNGLIVQQDILKEKFRQQLSNQRYEYIEWPHLKHHHLVVHHIRQHPVL